MQPLTERALNRATLDRQMLLERRRADAIRAISDLAGLNAQHVLSPYIALWSRVEGFAAEDLERAITAGTVLKATLQRGTLHLVRGEEYAAVWNALQGARRRAFQSFFPEESRSLDAERLVHLTHDAVAQAPLPFRDLEAHLASFFPDLRTTSLSFAAKALAPIVQVPPSGLRSQGGSALYGWVGVPKGSAEDLPLLVRTYLRAFGPATVQDIRQWSGLPAAAVKEAIAAAPDLLRLEGPAGHVFFDLQDADLPPEDTPAPPRLLPRWDNLLLAYKDRSRVLPAPYRAAVIQRDGRVLPTFLLDGYVAGTWDISASPAAAVVTLSTFQVLGQTERTVLLDEAHALCRWLHPASRSHDARFEDS